MIAEAANERSTRQLVEIVGSVDHVPSVVCQWVPVGSNWKIDGEWSRTLPALIIIHSSAFQYVSGQENHQSRLVNFIAAFSKRSPDTAYLVYSGGLRNGEKARTWLESVRRDLAARGSVEAGAKIDTIGFDQRELASDAVGRQIKLKVGAMLPPTK